MLFQPTQKVNIRDIPVINVNNHIIDRVNTYGSVLVSQQGKKKNINPYVRVSNSYVRVNIFFSLL